MKNYLQTGGGLDLAGGCIVFWSLLGPASTIGQPWHYWYMRSDNSLPWENALCIVGCWATFLASKWQWNSPTPEVPPPQMPPEVVKCPLWNKITLVENHWSPSLLARKSRFTLIFPWFFGGFSAPVDISELITSALRLEYIEGEKKLPWLMWHSALGIVLWTKRSLVRFLVRAHAWVAGQVPSWVCVRGNWLMYLSHINVSLPLFLSPFPSA